MSISGFQDPGSLCVSASQTHSLTDDAIKELEIVDPLHEGGASMLSSVFNGVSSQCFDMLAKKSRVFYSDARYLKDTQALTRNYSAKEGCDFSIVDRWKALYDKYSTDESFLTRFQYIDLDQVNWVNTNPLVCQALVMSNYTAPIINLLLPFVSVIIVLLLKFGRSGQLTINDIGSAMWNTIGKRLLGALTAPTLAGKFYAVLVTLLYFVNIYGNIRSCIKFRKSFVEIAEYLNCTLLLVEASKTELTNVLSSAGALKTYEPFRKHIAAYIEPLEECRNILTRCCISWYKGQRGYQFHAFHEMIRNTKLSTTCQWAANFLSYCESVHKIKSKLTSGELAHCTFSKKHSAFLNLRHPCISLETAVPNSVKTDKSIIITGPNASGKTTMVKGLMLNTLLCQQYGFGTFRKAKVALVEGMHCYMNIPDSSERDSLFQAEARRCKDILDTVASSNGPHLCLFDELYSGTNPIEAAGATSAYISYMAHHFPKTRFLLTTHLVGVCKDLAEHASMMMMGGEIDDSGFTPSYKCSFGVSTLRSGFLVLKELGYPQKIIDSLNTFVTREN